MAKAVIVNGVMTLQFDPTDHDDVINQKRQDVQGKGIKASSLSKTELEQLVVAMAQKLDIELT